MAPSDHDKAAATGGTGQTKKPSSESADRRRKPKQDAAVEQTENTQPTEPTEETEPTESTEETEPTEQIEVDEQVESAGVEPEVRGSGTATSSTVTEQPSAETGSAGASAVLTPLEGSAATSRPLSVATPNRGLARRLLRLLVLTVVVSGLAGAAYLIWPTINARYIQPVENTAADLSTVQGQLGDIDTRLEGLESATASLDTSVAANGARLDSTDAGQVLVTERLDELEDQVDRQTLRIENLDELASALGSDLEVATSTAAQQVQVTRAAERMSRARLFLYQANYGLAATDLLAARETLAAINAGAGSEYSQVIERLDRAIANLPEFPVSAAGDLDIAWETLLTTWVDEGTAGAVDVDGPDGPDGQSVEADSEPSDG